MHVFAIAALSSDGFLGQNVSHASIAWRSREDAQFFIAKTKEAKALVMGSRTFATMRRPMPGRMHYVLTSEPKRFSEYDPSLVVGLTATPQQVVEKAQQDGFDQLAVCGGSSVYTQFIQAGLVNRLFLTIEPILFGKGISLCNELLEVKLKLEKIHHLSEQTIVMEYQV